MKKKFLIIFLKIISVATISANKMMIPFEQNGKIGFVNENMEVIFYPEYSKILNYCFASAVRGFELSFVSKIIKDCINNFNYVT